mmetsp:Transcript_27901/g.20904  ORF Transcript_27901/g.20904 Transcript_27901/m.20904 type:complete len:114 (-) Transcript_27901:18-359(-)
MTFCFYFDLVHLQNVSVRDNFNSFEEQAACEFEFSSEFYDPSSTKQLSSFKIELETISERYRRFCIKMTKIKLKLVSAPYRPPSYYKQSMKVTTLLSMTSEVVSTWKNMTLWA